MLNGLVTIVNVFKETLKLLLGLVAPQLDVDLGNLLHTTDQHKFIVVKGIITSDWFMFVCLKEVT